MKLSTEQYKAIRRAIASIPGDVSNDAVGANVAKLDDMFAPESHSDALDPCTPIVLGSRGSGKSFWSSVLGQKETKEAAANAYPRLGLVKVDVQFGYTGVGGANGVTQEHIDDLIAPEGTIDDAKAFWWATILSAISRQANAESAARVKPKDYIDIARNWEQRENSLIEHEQRLQTEDKTLLVVYDALDTVARTWPRRRLLTEALLEVVWAMRAYRHIRLKLFLRPDQIHDDALRFVELPKLRTGAVKLVWSGEDLYGLLFSRLALTRESESKQAFKSLLEFNGLTFPDEPSILTRQWSLVSNKHDQKRIMEAMAGQYMGQGVYAYKKGNTYDWPISHLADAFAEVTPRSFLGMMISAARYKEPPEEKVITADGIRHGLREASKTRVDQLQQEFPWIKGVLAPLAGLLLPQHESDVIKVWQGANTIKNLENDATTHDYLPPFPPKPAGGEQELCQVLQHIGVMSRRNDDRVDMPDLFRVAAKLLKKGSITPM